MQKLWGLFSPKKGLKKTGISVADVIAGILTTVLVLSGTSDMTVKEGVNFILDNKLATVSGMGLVAAVKFVRDWFNHRNG